MIIAVRDTSSWDRSDHFLNIAATMTILSPTHHLSSSGLLQQQLSEIPTSILDHLYTLLSF